MREGEAPGMERLPAKGHNSSARRLAQAVELGGKARGVERIAHQRCPYG